MLFGKGETCSIHSDRKIIPSEQHLDTPDVFTSAAVSLNAIPRSLQST